MSIRMKIYNQDSQTIILLCSHLCSDEKAKPYAPAEWAKLSTRLAAAGMAPREILAFSDEDLKSKLDISSEEIERMNRLVERSASIDKEIKRYAHMGIEIITVADEHYPKALKQKLGKSCPPLFYYAGDPSLGETICIGFVGSRDADIDAERFTNSIVEKVNSKGFAVVSGGARGIDSIAQTASIGNGSSCIAYLPDSLAKRIKGKNVLDALLNSQLLLLSAAIPEAGFTTGMAMMRNKFIYSHSAGTVVIKSDYNKGGTWSGAIDSIKNKRCLTFCWNNPEYKGNLELINRGAIPIDEQWEPILLAFGFGDNSFASPDQFSLFGA